MIGFCFEFFEFVGNASDISFTFVLESVKDEVLKVLDFMRSKCGFCEGCEGGFQMFEEAEEGVSECFESEWGRWYLY